MVIEEPSHGPEESAPAGGLAPETLVALLYDELRRRARGYLGDERAGHTLQATALVNEVYLRLVGGAEELQDRADFLRSASRAMRQILVDHARRARARKRGGEEQRVPLDEGLALEGLLRPQPDGRLLALHAALEQLGAIDPRYERIVELRFFGGLSHAEIARVLGMSLRQVERVWTFARSWLHQKLTGEPDGR